jgi:membrane associated rhomboid family serine protease
LTALIMTHQGSDSDAPRRDDPLEEAIRRTLVRNYAAQRARWEATRPVATIGLIVAIAIGFVLQWRWGRGDPLVALGAMGSLVPAAVADGEVWRLASSAFLHAGLQHAAFNALALWILGSFVERILGTRRLLVLVLGSALAGNLASLAVYRDVQSVGASGGVWGLLGAGAVLGFASRGLLHPALVPGVRRAAGINLALNLFVSFLPQVNVAAHLGGGLCGAALMFVPAWTRGLPRYGPTDDPTRVDSASRVPGLAAVVLVAVFAVGIGAAWTHGRPWLPPDVLRWDTIAIERVGVRAHVPVSMDRTDEPDEGAVRFVRFGNLRAYPLIVRLGSAVRGRDAELPGDGAAGSMIDALLPQLTTPPQGFELDDGPDRQDGPRGPIATVRWVRRGDGIRFEVAAVRLPARDVVVYAAYRPADEDTFAGAALQVARSLVPLDRPETESP